ncbi:uncharacterized protein At5g39865-like [Lolium perenne]|jgi:glutaredoxin domain-containing cysteine-rich protein 1|uniref:uncharacterized protein At5g39865-like n=1 Tax=Lolium perenne TaxID=4522 RepID=UPI0021EB1517|nr:uncharacterized protein At5g39865-like [Lolium perenne]
MGCKGSKHALLDGAGCGARAPDPLRCSGLLPRHSVALSSSTLGTLSLDRATAAAAEVSFGGAEGAAAARKSTRWFPPSSSATEEPPKRQRRAPPRTPTKTPARDPEEINVWELMEGLDSDSDSDDGLLLRSAAGSPEYDEDVLSAFRDALAEFSPPPPDDPIKKEEIQVFAGVVRARLDAFQQRIDGGGRPGKNSSTPSPSPLRPPPESARRVVLYLTSLRGVRQTHEDCWAAATILAGYGVRVDERDLSMHAGYKDELRDALGLGTGNLVGLPQVFVDGWHLGGAEEVRRMHESGELAEALEACEPAPGVGVKEGSGLPVESCGGCGGARFVPCDVCSGSCKVFVQDDDGTGAFRRCPECNENGLLRCPIC